MGKILDRILGSKKQDENLKRKYEAVVSGMEKN